MGERINVVEWVRRQTNSGCRPSYRITSGRSYHTGTTPRERNLWSDFCTRLIFGFSNHKDKSISSSSVSVTENSTLFSTFCSPYVEEPQHQYYCLLPFLWFPWYPQTKKPKQNKTKSNFDIKGPVPYYTHTTVVDWTQETLVLIS